MADEDLRFNTLHRFRKRSPNLVLEQFSHCEVPAGCGGVVLRWRNPDQGLPVFFQVVSPCRPELWIDGQAVISSRVTLSWGEHLLALALTGLRQVDDPSSRFLVVAARPDLGGRGDDLPIDAILTADDGTWLATDAAIESDEGWREPDFDDRGWAALVRAPDDVAVPRGTQWLYESLISVGAAALLLPGDADRVFVRKRFAMERG